MRASWFLLPIKYRNIDLFSLPMSRSSAGEESPIRYPTRPGPSATTIGSSIASASRFSLA